MPWANGGGVTHEVVVEPAGASLSEFDWRLSVAEVREPGPFSSLPGVDRLLLLVSGAGMSVEVDGVVHEVSTESALAFQGESSAACVGLVDGPTLDLNVMVRRGQWSGSLEILWAGSAVRCDVDRLLVFALDSLDSLVLERGESLTLGSRSAVVRLMRTGGGGGVHAVEVRPALPGELGAAGDVAASAYAQGSQGSAEEQAYTEVVRATVARPDPGPVLVAVRGGEVVGTTTVCPPGTPHAELALPGELEFRFLAVAPAHQGTGIAQALLESVLTHAREMGAESAVCFVIEWNEPAHRLYLKRGFRRVPSRDWRPIPEALLLAYRLPLN